MARIGFIGLGNMGLPMAQNLLKAGHQVEGVDVSPAAIEKLKAAGGIGVETAKSAAARADVVITMLPSGKEVREVYLGSSGIVENANPGTLLIDCSTIDVETARAVAAEAEKKGLLMLDAPVSGGVGGATAAALRAHGFRLDMAGERHVGSVRVAEDARALGAHDVVVIAVKAQSLPALAPSLGPLLGPDTVVLTAMNGVPWWFFDRLPFGGGKLRLESLDPAGRLARAMPTERIVGCVIHLAASTPEPGLVSHNMGRKLRTRNRPRPAAPDCV